MRISWDLEHTYSLLPNKTRWLVKTTFPFNSQNTLTKEKVHFKRIIYLMIIITIIGDSHKHFQFTLEVHTKMSVLFFFFSGLMTKFIMHIIQALNFQISIIMKFSRSNKIDSYGLSPVHTMYTHKKTLTFINNDVCVSRFSVWLTQFYSYKRH